MCQVIINDDRKLSVSLLWDSTVCDPIKDCCFNQANLLCAIDLSRFWT